MDYSFQFRLSSLRVALLAAGVLGLSACATVAPSTPTAASAAGTAAATVANAATEAAAKVTDPKAAAGAQSVAAAARSSAPGAAAAAAAGPGAPKPFADVIKDAKEEKGFFTTWRKDDKVWIEIPEEMWERPFFFSINVTHSIGDSGLFGNQMGGFLATGRGQYYASFKKFGPQGVQLIARNVAYTAAKDAPIRHALERSFSDSLIGSAAIASAPHPERKSVLIEANALFINDFPMAAQQLEQTFRQPYSFDAKNSSIEKVRNSEAETGFNVRGHYQLNRLSIPNLAAPPAPGAPTPRFPTTLPDVRSLFMGYYYGFSKLPDPMRPRQADPRVGYFTTSVNDFTDPDKREQRTRYINRWRLEKKDPSAAMSEPKQPITYWLDKNIPMSYRKAVTEGILEWNKAFERIGFKNAVVVKQQGESDDFDTSATRFASVRWVAGNNIQFGARGPSKTDPRTGEILDADIEMNEDITRLYAARMSEDPPRPVGAGLIRSAGELCTYADGKLTEAAFAMDLLVARGDFEYGSPAAEAWLMDAIKDITAHEVGHTLGLRHNFKGSTSVTPDQLRDPKFGAEMGVSSSVMDYNALNIATKDERQGQYSMITVGAYDIWAIEYGYKETTPETEKAELAKTLSRATEPALAYATDEDAGFMPIVEGIDPDVNRGDLSNDPLAFYEKRFSVIRELWDRVQARELAPGTKYETLGRNFNRGFNLMGQISELTAKYVGGVNVLRDVAGSGRAPLTPVDADKQRRALNLITKNLFTVDAFKFKPEFLSKLVPDFDARSDALFDDDVGLPVVGAIDASVAGRVFNVQRATLNQLMRDSVAARLVAAPEKLSDASKALGLPELYGTLQKAIWSELVTGTTISPMRRNLQREHVRMMAEAVARPSPRMPADARALQREFTVDLLAQMRKAAAKPGLAIENRAHLNESIALLDAALKAQVAKVIG